MQIDTEKAIRLAGGRLALAQLLGITPGAVSHWDKTIPDGRAWQLRGLRPEWFEDDVEALVEEREKQEAKERAMRRQVARLERIARLADEIKREASRWQTAASLADVRGERA